MQYYFQSLVSQLHELNNETSIGEGHCLYQIDVNHGIQRSLLQAFSLKAIKQDLEVEAQTQNFVISTFIILETC